MLLRLSTLGAGLFSIACEPKGPTPAPDGVGPLLVESAKLGGPAESRIFRDGIQVEAQTIDAEQGYLGSNFGTLTEQTSSNLDAVLKALETSDLDSQSACTPDDRRLSLFVPPTEPPPEPVVLFMSCAPPPELIELRALATDLLLALQTCDAMGGVVPDDDCEPREEY